MYTYSSSYLDNNVSKGLAMPKCLAARIIRCVPHSKTCHAVPRVNYKAIIWKYTVYLRDSEKSARTRILVSVTNNPNNSYDIWDLV